jgi:hypothetical protein
MNAPAFLCVGEHVARNPIARAIAKTRLQRAVSDFALRLYLLADGEDVSADIHAAGHVICVALAIVEARKEDAPDLRAGLDALIAMPDGKWSLEAAAVLDVALQEAMAIYGEASAVETQRAFLRVSA